MASAKTIGGVLVLVPALAAVALAACAQTGAARTQDVDRYLPVNTMLVANGCSNCHAADYTRVGPPINAIAAAYADASPEELAQLRAAIIGGVKGKWGPAIMPPQFQVTPARADEIVEIIRKYGLVAD